MGATAGMRQTYHSHIHQKDSAPVESIISPKIHVPDLNRLVRHVRHKRYAAAQEWSAGLYWPGTLARLSVRFEGVQGSPVPTMFTPTIAFEPNKGITAAVHCGY